MKVGVDVGGTFTDAVLLDGDALVSCKVPSRRDQSEGVVDALERIGARDAHLLHGTTVATNTVLERSGARTVLVCDAGFEDLLEIGRQDRPSLYDGAVTRAEPLVPSERRVGEMAKGASSPPDIDALVRRVAALEPEAVAISALYSFQDGSQERAVRDALREALGDIAISVSSEVVAEFREFERTSTTVLDAYLRPAVALYLNHLKAATEGSELVSHTSVMRSSGGLLSLDGAAALPVATLLSGPAAGVVAAAAAGAGRGVDSLVSFDMGGTSTDVCRIDGGRPEIVYERAVGGLPCRMPSVAIHTVGAGGGSVAWGDAGGALRVGPRSAGAQPGPASYGLGGLEPTVTDAHAALGRIADGARLGGSVRVKAQAGVAALGRVAEETGMAVVDAALGVIAVVEAHMERAIRRVSVEEGSDPRGAVLVAFGGAGALHATALARRLDMAGVLIPPFAGVFSALGLLLAAPRSDAARTIRVDASAIDAAAGDVLATARQSLYGPVVDESVIVDMRYVGQSHETSVPYRPGEGWSVLVGRFQEAHEARNGFSRPGDPVEVVTVRAEVVGAPAARWESLPPVRPGGEQRRGTRSVITVDGELDASVWWRPGLWPRTEVVGPAVIDEPDATTFVGPGERAVVAEDGSLEVSW